jgi:hypothetical protein
MFPPDALFLRLVRFPTAGYGSGGAKESGIPARAYRGAQMVAGRGRYPLWTGDIGLAIYLSDCITGDGRLPTIDVFRL